MDLAVAVVIGTAFAAVVTALVADLVTHVPRVQELHPGVGLALRVLHRAGAAGHRLS